MKPLNNKKAIVTGGSRGIGAAVALKLAQAGAEICITGRNEQSLVEMAERIRTKGVDCHPIVCDFSQTGNVRKAGEKILDISGHWEILVNNAGIAKKIPLTDIREEDWDEILTVNLKSAFILSQIILPGMIKRKWGKIINISSLGSFYGTPGMGAYAVSKAGLNQLTRTMAAEFGKHNIQVNAICPTIVLTDMARDIWDTDENKDLRDAMLSKIPAKRFGEPEDVASLALFLASEESNYINGLSVPLEGGKMSVP